MEKVKLYWQIAESVGFAPMVAIIGLAAYFTLRWGMGMEKWKAISIVFALNILGQARMAHGLSEWDDVLYLAAGQAFVTFGVYSTLEVMKVIDILDALKSGLLVKIKKLLGGGDAQNPPAV
jgi:hypothetical protein